MKTRVYITIDVECREERLIHGKCQPSAGYDLRMWGRFCNQSQDLGIGLIMRELDPYSFKATFYVDPFGSLFFGNEGLTQVCQEIRQRGHDVQLHAHPIQRFANWISQKQSVPSDKLADYSLDEQTQLIQEGIDILAACGIPREEIVSFRAGHFAANNATWKAMNRCGLKISSNHNLCYKNKEACRIDWPSEAPGLFDTGAGVWELPISNFVESTGGYRHFQVTAISLSEMKDYLMQAHALGISEVTVVTHSFEFFYIDSVTKEQGRLNTVNLRRLRGLAKFLDASRDCFEVETVRALAAGLPPEKVCKNSPLPRGRRSLKVERLFQQGYKRLELNTPSLEGLSRFLVAH